MGIILLTAIIFIIFIVLSYLSEKYDWDGLQCFSWVVIVFSGVILIIELLCLIDLDRSFQKRIDEYNSIKQTIEYSRDNDLSEFERIQLIDKIFKINEEIASHKNYHDSFWTGLYYSKELGELDYIK